jgi:hypothetical protein
MANSPRWRRLGKAQLAEIDRAVRQASTCGLGWQTVTAEDFPLPPAPTSRGHPRRIGGRQRHRAAARLSEETCCNYHPARCRRAPIEMGEIVRVPIRC